MSRLDVRRRSASSRLLLLLLMTLAGCSQESWNSTPIKGLMPSLAFHLTDGQGQAVTALDYRGKVCLLYFGFTHCQGVCPTTLNTLGAAVRDLGRRADQARVLFVSLDPWRDTPPVLAAYSEHFGPQVVGLTGTIPALAALAKRYRVVFDQTPPSTGDQYVVNHSNAIFVFDRQGQARLLMREDEGVPALAADLKRLVEE